jgi:hypothetical protein
MRDNRNFYSTTGLDVGTSRIVAARRAGDDFQYDSQLNAFVTIPYSKMTAAVLERESVPHTVQSSDILVYGNESEKFAGLLDVEIRRPMTRGTLDAKEPEGLNLIQQIITSMIGSAPKTGQKLYFTVPAPPLGGQESLTYHETTMRQLLSGLGYETRAVNEGLAVIYGEMENSNYTGIGISCGGGLCNVAMSYLSVPVLSFSVPKAGDFIDASAAAVTGERANRIRILKEESFYLNGSHGNKLQQVIAVYYDDTIDTLVQSLKDAFAGTRSLPRIGKPVPVVLSGGTAMPRGFRDRFEEKLRGAKLPVEISEVRLASSPLHAAAKGVLVAALTDL